MSISKEFKINQYLSLRLIGKDTEIYIKEKCFITCTFLLMNILLDELQPLENITSIDEIAEKLNGSMEKLNRNKKDTIISPEEEFWGHCSNLQVWYENNYDTRLLRSNVSFPLLKELTNLGDPIAKKVFKEEIAKRFDSGCSSVVNYLLNESYHTYLTKEEFYSVFLNYEDLEIINQFQNYLYEKLVPFYLEKERMTFEDAKRKAKIRLLADIPKIDNEIQEREKLARENPFHYWSRDTITTYACRNKSVIKLFISQFPKGIEIPEFIKEFKNLEELYLEDNHLEKFPEWLYLCHNLKFLYIYDEYFTNFFLTEEEKEKITFYFKRKNINFFI